MTASGSSDSLVQYPEICAFLKCAGFTKHVRGPLWLSPVYLICKKVVLRDLSELRSVSREQKLDKRIDLRCQSHAL